jgi:hypothetical protein
MCYREREIPGFLRSGLNLPLSVFRQDQLSKGAVPPLPTPVYSPALDLPCCIGRRHTHVGLVTLVSNQPLPYASSAKEGQPTAATLVANWFARPRIKERDLTHEGK